MIRIAHISDQQIRIFKRHKEFKAQFELLYESLRKHKPDLICFAGDVLHDKSHTSPEQTKMLGDHITSLCSIAPTVVVPGNHDGVLNNQTRLDSLTPVFDLIKRSTNNLYYFKESGIFKLNTGNKELDSLSIYNFSCFGNESEWPKRQNDDGIKIGVFHGMVQGAKLQNGQIVEESPYKLRYFLDIVDYLLVGDIHQMQFLDAESRAAYCGSYPQQNFAETIEKGYLLWSIENDRKHTVDFIELENLYPFVTITLDDSLVVPKDLKIKKTSRIRIVCRSLSSSEKKKIQDDVIFSYDPQDVVFHDIVKQEDKIVKIVKDENKNQIIGDKIVQDGLLKSFLQNKNVAEEKIVKVLELSKKYDLVSREDDTLRNVQYKFKRMKFDNMFSYGEDNVFNFKDYKGMVGVFGGNACGKSSLIVDIPSYILFNKTSKKGVVKNDLIINDKKEFCAGELEIEVGQDTYLISRNTCVYLKSGKKVGDPVYQGKTDVDFKILKKDGTTEDRNGEERGTTDKDIRRIFGSPEDFFSTSVAPQWQLLGLLDAGATERLKLIGKYFDIDIFEQKNKLAKEDCKSVKSQLRLFEGINFDDDILKLENDLVSNQEKVSLVKSEMKVLHEQLQQLKKNIQKKEIQTSKFQDKSFTYQRDKKSLLEQIALLDAKIVSIKNYPCISNPNCCLQDDVKKNEDKKKEINTRIDSVNLQIEENNRQLQEHVVAIKKTEEETKCEELERKIKELIFIIENLKRDEGALGKSIEQKQKDKIIVGNLKSEYEIYDYFMSATSKDGISKEIISNNLNIINSQIDKIISTDTNFKVYLESADEGKSIEIFFAHNGSKPRRIEICSGMEKSIAAIAIRASLVSITSLPRSNVFILDEVFMALDNEYVGVVEKMLERIKEMFDTVFIITHIEAFKDLVDHVVEIARDSSGNSKIIN